MISDDFGYAVAAGVTALQSKKEANFGFTERQGISKIARSSWMPEESNVDMDPQAGSRKQGTTSPLQNLKSC